MCFRKDFNSFTTIVNNLPNRITFAKFKKMFISMKTATVKQIKTELNQHSPAELVDLCLRLSKFKKENKELLTYLLYEAHNEHGFIQGVKTEIDEQFELINTSSYYFIKKSVRKILRRTKTYIRYSKKKETEVELLIYFCQKLMNMSPAMQANVALFNIYKRQFELIKKTLKFLHEDLQFDYHEEIAELEVTYLD